MNSFVSNHKEMMKFLPDEDDIKFHSTFTLNKSKLRQDSVQFLSDHYNHLNINLTLTASTLEGYSLIVLEFFNQKMNSKHTWFAAYNPVESLYYAREIIDNTLSLYTKYEGIFTKLHVVGQDFPFYYNQIEPGMRSIPSSFKHHRFFPYPIINSQNKDITNTKTNAEIIKNSMVTAINHPQFLHIGIINQSRGYIHFLLLHPLTITIQKNHSINPSMNPSISTPISTITTIPPGILQIETNNMFLMSTDIFVIFPGIITTEFLNTIQSQGTLFTDVLIQLFSTKVFAYLLGLDTLGDTLIPSLYHHITSSQSNMCLYLIRDWKEINEWLNVYPSIWRIHQEIGIEIPKFIPYLFAWLLITKQKIIKLNKRLYFLQSLKLTANAKCHLVYDLWRNMNENLIFLEQRLQNYLNEFGVLVGDDYVDDDFDIDLRSFMKNTDTCRLLKLLLGIVSTNHCIDFGANPEWSVIKFNDFNWPKIVCAQNDFVYFKLMKYDNADLSNNLSNKLSKTSSNNSSDNSSSNSSDNSSSTSSNTSSSTSSNTSSNKLMEITHRDYHLIPAYPLHISKYDIVQDIYGNFCRVVRIYDFNAILIENLQLEFSSKIHYIFKRKYFPVPNILKVKKIHKNTQKPSKSVYLCPSEIVKIIQGSSIQECANPKCKKPLFGKKRVRCSRCQLVACCNRHCMKKCWKYDHRNICKDYESKFCVHTKLW